MQLIKDIIAKKGLINIVFSEPSKLAEYSKIKVRMIEGRNVYWQAEKYKENKVFHQNISVEEIEEFLVNTVFNYRQLCAIYEGETRQVFFYGKKPKIRKTPNNMKLTSREHDRKKNYLLNEGENIPPLVDLGIFTADGKVINDKYDKFKQINRFIEIVGEAVDNNKKLTIADFGCGKSYLTFLLYYYLKVKNGIDVEITGYDLKKDVVENCNKTAQKYGYNNLEFKCGDVAKESIKSGTDMMVTLHACDTATDYAIATAIKSGVKYLFSVPCCQHEINSCIKKGGDYDIMLKHGLIKERFCALLTDAIRAEVLEDFGYKTDVIEFVDFEHSPKNIMLRAVKTTDAPCNKSKKLFDLCQRYGIDQTLLKLIYNNKKEK